MCFAHGGGSFTGTRGRSEHGFHARPDLVAIDHKRSPREYLGKFYVDALVHDAQALRFILEVYGEDSLVLGSDDPFPLGEEKPGALVKEVDIAVTKILQSNARRCVGL